jgi:predicted adenine nucleotide alpha hydrolase (AANH) superfamily ATPase
LLVSRHQKHDLIRLAGEEAGKEFGVAFYYKDWRPLNARSVELAKKLSLYRQRYCGCLFGQHEQLKRQARKRIHK